MIIERIQALFDFVDYLDKRKAELIDKYLPICNEITELDIQRSKLRPRSNYIDKQKYDEIQKTITEKFQPITQDIYIPVLNRLKELKIWSGDEVFTSIWNNNSSAIYEFRESFESSDIEIVIAYKKKYLDFRNETNSNFLCLQIILNNLDEIYKALFDFFNDSSENEFESFETKTIEVNSIADVLKGFAVDKGKNVKYSIPQEGLFDYRNVEQYLPKPTNIKNEIIMGHKIQIGDINENSGQIVIGMDITVSDSPNSKSETVEKITELINLIIQEQTIDREQKQSLITNFDKVREEILEDQPNKLKIFKWLSTTKGILENFVLTHDVTEAVHWVYNNLNFLIH